MSAVGVLVAAPDRKPWGWQLTDWDDVSAMREIATAGPRSLAAQDWVYRTYSRSVSKLAGVLVGRAVRTEDIEDFLQDTFIKAFARADQYRGGAGLLTYLYRILGNLVRDALRHDKRFPDVSIDDDDVADGLLAEMERTLGSAPSPLRQLHEAEIRDCVRGALETLRERSAWAVSAFWLKICEDVDQKEIAEILGRSYDATRRAFSHWTPVVKALLAPCYELTKA